MYPPVTTAEQISVGNLERYVEGNYSEKSQKLYLAVLKQIRAYGGGIWHPLKLMENTLQDSGHTYPTDFLPEAYPNICAVCARC